MQTFSRGEAGLLSVSGDSVVEDLEGVTDDAGQTAEPRASPGFGDGGEEGIDDVTEGLGVEHRRPHALGGEHVGVRALDPLSLPDAVGIGWVSSERNAPAARIPARWRGR